MSPVYSLDQIKDHWHDYQTSHCWKLIKHGGEKVIKMQAPQADDYLQCNMVLIKSAMSFPRYLEIIA